MGALKYFILKVDPKKNMTFNPKESIDFNGNTGPFIQYTHARIKSVLRKAEEQGIVIPEKLSGSIPLSEKEEGLVQMLSEFGGNCETSRRRVQRITNRQLCVRYGEGVQPVLPRILHPSRREHSAA